MVRPVLHVEQVWRAECAHHNRGDGTFEDVAAAAGVADLNRPGDGVSMGSVWGDFDNDGREDLLVYRYGYLALFRSLTAIISRT